LPAVSSGRQGQLCPLGHEVSHGGAPTGKGGPRRSYWRRQAFLSPPAVGWNLQECNLSSCYHDYLPVQTGSSQRGCAISSETGRSERTKRAKGYQVAASAGLVAMLVVVCNFWHRHDYSGQWLSALGTVKKLEAMAPTHASSQYSPVPRSQHGTEEAVSQPPRQIYLPPTVQQQQVHPPRRWPTNDGVGLLCWPLPRAGSHFSQPQPGECTRTWGKLNAARVSEHLRAHMRGAPAVHVPFPSHPQT